LLTQLRAAMPGAVEKKPGTFYRKGQALLHFHEDPAGLFADLKRGKQWERFEVNTAAQKRVLLEQVRQMLG
jgi:hypothetical protein